MLFKQPLVTALSRPERARQNGEIVLGYAQHMRGVPHRDVANKRGPSELDRALRLEDRAGMVYWGHAKHEQAEKNDSDEPPQCTLRRAMREESYDDSLLKCF